ncbi:MAG TPA: hypothetical protein PK036_16010, partial [Geobacteraceae bacterium]|nr:hypothetical protein [Geobacteraceae bacterium]
MKALWRERRAQKKTAAPAGGRYGDHAHLSTTENYETWEKALLPAPHTAHFSGAAFSTVWP